MEIETPQGVTLLSLEYIEESSVLNHSNLSENILIRAVGPTIFKENERYHQYTDIYSSLHISLLHKVEYMQRSPFCPPNRSKYKILREYHSSHIMASPDLEVNLMLAANLVHHLRNKFAIMEKVLNCSET